MKGLLWKTLVIAACWKFALAQPSGDQETIQNLMQNRAQISRDVEQTENGVLTHTYSSNPEVAAMIQKHVGEMKKRVEENNVIRADDPLFVSVFANSASIDFQYTAVDDGVRVTETGSTQCAIDLVHAHAKVVTLFIENGNTEVQKAHNVPSSCEDGVEGDPKTSSTSTPQPTTSSSSTTTPQHTTSSTIATTPAPTTFSSTTESPSAPTASSSTAAKPAPSKSSSTPTSMPQSAAASSTNPFATTPEPTSPPDPPSGCDPACDANAGCDGGSCTCNAGYSGDGSTCANVDECATGDASCDAEEGTCTDAPGSFTCSCNAGYALAADAKTCEQITDDCAPACDANAACVASVCTCNAGFVLSGTACSDEDECSSGAGERCPAHAACTNTVGSFTCACNAGFAAAVADGAECANVDECAGATGACDGNATCADSEGSFTCACNAGYEGDGVACSAVRASGPEPELEEDSDECATGSHNCHAEATCSNTEGSFTCTCNTGFSGTGSECVVAIAPRARVRMVVELAYTVAQFQAPAVTEGFKRGVAAAAGTAADSVTINAVTAKTVRRAARKLLADAVDVDFSLEAATEAAAQDLVDSDKLSLDSLNTALAAEDIQLDAIATPPAVQLSADPDSDSAAFHYNTAPAAISLLAAALALRLSLSC